LGENDGNQQQKSMDRAGVGGGIAVGVRGFLAGAERLHRDHRLQRNGFAVCHDGRGGGKRDADGDGYARGSNGNCAVLQRHQYPRRGANADFWHRGADDQLHRGRDGDAHREIQRGQHV